MTTKQEVMAFMTGQGEMVCPFNQADFGKKFLDQENEPKRVATKEGYCTGVCLEWLRRVLQKGSNSLLNPDKQKLVQRLDEKVNISFDAFQATVDPALPATQEEKRYKAFVGLEDHLTDLLNEQPPQHEFILATNVRALILKLSGLAMPPQKISRKNLEQIADILKLETEKAVKLYSDAVSKRGGQSRAVAGWVNVVQGLDNSHAAIRMATTGREPATRTFSGIRPIEHASSSFWAANRPSTAARTALATPEFTSGTGMIFDVETGPRAGHAYGLYRQDTDVIHFLDPNFGVFLYTQQRVETVMDYLWQDGGTTGKGIYSEMEMHGTGQYRHSLFEPVQAQ